MIFEEIKGLTTKTQGHENSLCVFVVRRNHALTTRILYMPGDDWKKITKAITLGVDCICMDMEDGVAVNKKAEARGTIAKALQELDFGKSEKLARINAVGSGMEKE